MRAGTMIENYFTPNSPVKIRWAEGGGLLYSGPAKSIPDGFYEFNIRKLGYENDAISISIRTYNPEPDPDSALELKMMDLKSATWITSQTPFTLRYEDANDSGLARYNTLRALNREYRDDDLVQLITLGDCGLIIHLKKA